MFYVMIVIVKLVNQRKEFAANLNELKREKPNDLSHMLPKYIIN